MAIRTSAITKTVACFPCCCANHANLFWGLEHQWAKEMLILGPHDLGVYTDYGAQGAVTRQSFLPYKR